MSDCYKVGPRKSEWFAPFLVNRLLRSLPWCFSTLRRSSVCRLSTAAHGEKNIVLRGLIGGCSAGCSHDGPPLFNGMTLINTDIMDDDYITNTRGVLAACAARGSQTLSMRGERWFAAQVGASWRAGAAIHFPLVLDGYISDFVAAAARAQSELWLPSGVARKPSAS